MKRLVCLFWKCCVVALALAVLLPIGAFAEGSIGFVSAAVCTLALCAGVRGCWGLCLRTDVPDRPARRARTEMAAPLRQAAAPSHKCA